jgi:hypothetical protein
MPKLVTYQVPALDKKSGKVVTLEKRGYVANLYVGNVQEKFVLQLGIDGLPELLVHYATGQKFGDTLNSVKVRNMLAYGSQHHTPDRKAAEQIIAEIIARVGIDKVRSVMRSAPIINA